MREYTKEELYGTAANMLSRLIATPSYSKEEFGTAALIQTYLQAQGIPAQRFINNVWAKNLHYDANKPTLLLNSHHDTVKPNEGYTNDPFNPIQKDGKLYGLGSNDAGGCLVSLLATFLYFYGKQDLKYNIIFAASAEEEISGADGIAALLPEFGKIDVAIVGEPTLLQMAVAEKGLMVLDCEASGVSGHAARNEGSNAIYNAFKDLHWFAEHQFPKVSELLGPVKMTVTMINAGTQHNVVPATCKFTVDVRINECYTNEELLEEIRQNVTCKVMARSMRLRSTSIHKEHPLVQAGLKLGKEIFGSSTLSDKVFMNFPALKIGPGDSARSHMADEFIYLNEIEEGIDTYINILKEIL